MLYIYIYITGLWSERREGKAKLSVRVEWDYVPGWPCATALDLSNPPWLDIMAASPRRVMNEGKGK